MNARHARVTLKSLRSQLLKRIVVYVDRRLRVRSGKSCTALLFHRNKRVDIVFLEDHVKVELSRVSSRLFSQKYYKKPYK